jgi:hypothetical protein
VLARDAVNGNEGFLDNPIIKADELKNDQGRLIFADQLKSVPKQYQKVKKAPLILIILTVLVAGVLVLLSENHLKGLRHVGVVLVIGGLFMLFFAWGLNYGVNNKALPKISVQDNAVVTKDVKSVVAEVTRTIDKNYWWFGGIYLTLGAASIATAEVFIRRNKPDEPTSEKQAAGPATEAKPAKPKPKQSVSG